MIVLRTTFVAPQGCSYRPGEQFILDLVWLSARAADRIEHVRVLAGPLGFAVVWFLLGPDEQTARDTVLAVSRRVIDATPLLADWSVV